MTTQTSASPRIEIAERPVFDSRIAPIEAAQKKPAAALYWMAALGAAALAGHVFLMFRVPVIGDEAYYWLWSKHLAWGYHDHPPLIGWLIAASTRFSDSPFFVRLPALVCLLASSVFFCDLARNVLGDFKKAGWALLLFLYLPILALSSVAVFPDTALVFSWILCLWAGWKSLRDGRYWLLTGAALGLACLSKLMGLFLAGSFALFFLMDRPARFWLRTGVFWAGVGAAFLVSLPLWVWNARHGFENFVFQMHDHLGIPPLHPLCSFLGYAGVQWLSCSPVLFVLLLMVSVDLVRRSFQGDLSSRYLLSFALPIHLFFGILPFAARAGFHWAAPGYISLLIAVPRFKGFRRRRMPALGGAVFFTFLFFAGMAYPRQAAGWIIPLEKSHPQWRLRSFFAGKGYGEILGYEKLAQEVRKRMAEENKAAPAFLLTDSYTLSGDLTYYAGIQAHTYLATGQGGEYARWDDFENLRGQNALWIGLSPLSGTNGEVRDLRGAFARIGKNGKITVQDGPVTRTFYAVRLIRLKNPNFLRFREE